MDVSSFLQEDRHDVSDNKPFILHEEEDVAADKRLMWMMEECDDDEDLLLLPSSISGMGSAKAIPISNSNLGKVGIGSSALTINDDSVDDYSDDEVFFGPVGRKELRLQTLLATPPTKTVCSTRRNKILELPQDGGVIRELPTSSEPDLDGNCILQTSTKKLDFTNTYVESSNKNTGQKETNQVKEVDDSDSLKPDRNIEKNLENIYNDDAAAIPVLSKTDKLDVEKVSNVAVATPVVSKKLQPKLSRMPILSNKRIPVSCRSVGATASLASTTSIAVDIAKSVSLSAVPIPSTQQTYKHTKNNLIRTTKTTSSEPPVNTTNLHKSSTVPTKLFQPPSSTKYRQIPNLKTSVSNIGVQLQTKVNTTVTATMQQEPSSLIALTKAEELQQSYVNRNVVKTPKVAKTQGKLAFEKSSKILTIENVETPAGASKSKKRVATSSIPSLRPPKQHRSAVVSTASKNRSVLNETSNGQRKYDANPPDYSNDNPFASRCKVVNSPLNSDASLMEKPRSRWSPIRKMKPVSLEEECTMITKKRL